MLFLILGWVVNILLVLLSVAFFTLFERNVIGAVHIRLGPNKVVFGGLLQPLLDAFKLLSKQNLTSVRANKFIFSMAPHFSLIFSLIFWHLLLVFFYTLSNSYSILVFLLIGSLMVFCNLIAGWSSNSNYTLIGSLRSVAQSVSYEAVITTIVVMLVIVGFSFCIYSISNISSPLFFLILPLWVISVLAETHRAPFDFSESESELVSGYNTEYSGAYFAYVFLAEYSSLLFSCFFIVFIFFGVFSPILTVLVSLLFSFLFIIIRVSFPRFRYDFLIILAWKVLLPLSLILLLLVFTI